jgi:Zn-dependent peptidase ImmA (M78 family)/DNA-binding XRE family transcriptional regulator
MNKEVIGLNLKRIREGQNLSQTQLAEMAGISRLTYRKIESGESIPKVNTLQQIVTALGVKLPDLLAPALELKKVRFRALKKLKSRDHILTEVSRWLEDYHYLEDLLKEYCEYKFEDLALEMSSYEPGEERAKKAAVRAREILGLSKKEPIRDIAGLMEENGIKVYPFSLASDGFFGLSVAKEEGGPAMAVNVWDRISVERWIFSAAHELGHLILHLNAFDVKESVEDPAEEQEANIFASYFLMPEGAFNKEWDEAYGLAFVDRVLKVKRIFQVSYKTVLYRLSLERGRNVWAKFQVAYKSKTGKSLRMTDEPDALSPSSFQQSFPEVFRSQEPDSLSSSDFIEDRLSRLVRIAIENEKITLGRGAEILRLDLDDMRDRVSSWE